MTHCRYIVLRIPVEMKNVDNFIILRNLKKHLLTMQCKNLHVTLTLVNWNLCYNTKNGVLNNTHISRENYKLKRLCIIIFVNYDG